MSRAPMRALRLRGRARRRTPGAGSQTSGAWCLTNEVHTGCTRSAAAHYALPRAAQIGFLVAPEGGLQRVAGCQGRPRWRMHRWSPTRRRDRTRGGVHMFAFSKSTCGFDVDVRGAGCVVAGRFLSRSSATPRPLTPPLPPRYPRPSLALVPCRFRRPKRAVLPRLRAQGSASPPRNTA